MSEVAKAKRTTAKRVFTRTEKALIQALDTNALEETIQRRFEEFRRQWDKVQEAHDTYIEVLEEYSEEAIAKEDEWLDEVSNRFYDLELRVDNDLLEKRKAEEQILQALKKEKEPNVDCEDERKTTLGNKDKVNTIQLERMKFEQFDGSIRKYPQFKNEFQTYVKPLINSSQLPFVLRSYLSREVKEEVENVEDNYETLWERLDEKYGDRGQLIDSIMADIKNLKVTSDNNDEGTIELIKVVEKAQRDLCRIREQDQMNNATIISVIEQKLPDKILNEWIKEVSVKNKAHRTRFLSLMQLLSEWRKRIEYRLATIRLRETERKSEKPKTGHANHSSGTSQFRKEKCWIHTDSEHPIWRCNTFQSKPVEERINLAKLNQACTLCLEVGHDVSQCKRKFRCMEKDCNERHNNLLHVDPVKGIIHHADEVDTSQIPTILPLQNL